MTWPEGEARRRRAWCPLPRRSRRTCSRRRSG